MTDPDRDRVRRPRSPAAARRRSSRPTARRCSPPATCRDPPDGQDLPALGDRRRRDPRRPACWTSRTAPPGPGSADVGRRVEPRGLGRARRRLGPADDDADRRTCRWRDGHDPGPRRRRRGAGSSGCPHRWGAVAGLVAGGARARLGRARRRRARPRQLARRSSSAARRSTGRRGRSRSSRSRRSASTTSSSCSPACSPRSPCSPRCSASLAVRRRRTGAAGVVALGLVATVAAATRPDARWYDVLPSLDGRPWPAPGAVPAGAAAARATGAGAARAGPARTRPTPAARPSPPAARCCSRRRGPAVAVVAGGGGRWLLRAAHRRRGLAPRAQCCRAPGSPARPLPAGARLEHARASRRSSRRTRTSTASTPRSSVPRLTTADWRLRVHGMVDRELELTFDDLLDRPVVERDITLTCVSNEVGGNLLGTARWLGVELAPLLRDAGVRPGVDAARQPLGRRDDDRHAGRRRPRRPRRDARLRDERRAAAARARLPGADGRARPVRVRVGHEVARRPRADHVRGLRRLLGRTRLGGAGGDQDQLPDRHAASRSRPCGPAGSRSAVSRGRSTAGSRRSRSAWTRASGRRPPCRRRPAPTCGGSGSGSGTPRPAATCCRSGPRTPPARCRPRSGGRRSRTAPTGWQSLLVTVAA